MLPGGPGSPGRAPHRADGAASRKQRTCLQFWDAPHRPIAVISLAYRLAVQQLPFCVSAFDRYVARASRMNRTVAILNRRRVSRSLSRASSGPTGTLRSGRRNGDHGRRVTTTVKDERSATTVKLSGIARDAIASCPGCREDGISVFARWVLTAVLLGGTGATAAAAQNSVPATPAASAPLPAGSNDLGPAA